VVLGLVTLLTGGSAMFLAMADRSGPDDTLDLEVAIGKIKTVTLNISGNHQTGPLPIRVSPELESFLFVTDNPLASADTVSRRPYSNERSHGGRSF
jgi:hypothetical protein